MHGEKFDKRVILTCSSGSGVSGVRIDAWSIVVSSVCTIVIVVLVAKSGGRTPAIAVAAIVSTIVGTIVDGLVVVVVAEVVVQSIVIGRICCRRNWIDLNELCCRFGLASSLADVRKSRRNQIPLTFNFSSSN